MAILKPKTFLAFTIVISSLLINSCKKDVVPIATPAMKLQLGKALFFDKTLSNPSGQSCSSCHSPGTGFSDPNHNMISPGAVDGLFGNRNAPNISYSAFTPANLQYDPVDSGYFGGFFMDGRVNTLEEQAQKPFLNVLEMANVDAAMVFSKLQNSPNYSLFKQVYGNISDANTAFTKMADALATFERSDEMNPFTSKYDYYLKGQASLTAEELSGMQLFTDTLKGKCANCHLITADPASNKILFTDHTYTNDGVPKNPNNPYYLLSAAFNPQGSAYVDYGLGGFLNRESFHVPQNENQPVFFVHLG